MCIDRIIVNKRRKRDPADSTRWYFVLQRNDRRPTRIFHRAHFSSVRSIYYFIENLHEKLLRSVYPWNIRPHPSSKRETLKNPEQNLSLSLSLSLFFPVHVFTDNAGHHEGKLVIFFPPSPPSLREDLNRSFIFWICNDVPFSKGWTGSR